MEQMIGVFLLATGNRQAGQDEFSFLRTPSLLTNALLSTDL